MKRNYLYTYIAAAAMTVTLSSCDKFLDESPNPRAELDSAEDVQELLVSAYPEGLYMPICEAMSDNAGDKVNLGSDSKVNADMYFWRSNNDVNVYDTPSFFWKKTWAAIASANQALEEVKKLGGGRNTDYLKGEALVARAYNHFLLGFLWCKPYNPSTAAADLGLPYVVTPETHVFERYKRISLKEYYDAIERDLQEGLPLIDNTKYKKARYHFTTEAAHVFASRFYLMKGEWDRVIFHANAALGSDPTPKLRDIRGQRGLGYYEQGLRYSASDEPANALVMSVMSSFNHEFATNKYGLTLELSDAITAAMPLRKMGYPATWAYTFYGNDDYKNIPKFQEYFKYENVSIGIGERYNMVAALTYDEAFLNRLEAYVMTDQKQKFLDDFITFMRKKTRQTIPDDFAVTESEVREGYGDQGDAFHPYYESQLTEERRELLQCVMDIRRMVFVFEGLRWFDNKRLGMTIEHKAGSAGNVYVLNKDDKRRELQIPIDATNAGVAPNPR